MPFTLSHIAIVIPLKIKPLNFSSLVIGSLVPDTLYFLPKNILYFNIHTISGLFFFCLPIGLFFYFFWEYFLKKPSLLFLHNLLNIPTCEIEFRLSFRSIFLASFSIFLGSYLHIFWDSFTHNYGSMVEALPFLKSVIFTVKGEPIYAFKLLQYASSTIGGIILSFWIFKKILLNGGKLNHKLFLKILILFLTISLASILLNHYHLNKNIKIFVVQSVITLINISLLIWLFSCLAFYFKERLTSP